MTNLISETLRAAEAAVNGDRNTTYGNVETSFLRAAALLDGFLEARDPGPFRGSEVAQIMVLLKMARVLNAPNSLHLDNHIDMAGYLAIAALLIQREV